MGREISMQEMDVDWREAAERLERLVLDADRLSLDGILGSELEDAFFRYVKYARRMLVGLRVEGASVEAEEQERLTAWDELYGLLAVMQSDLDLLREQRSP